MLVFVTDEPTLTYVLVAPACVELSVTVTVPGAVRPMNAHTSSLLPTVEATPGDTVCGDATVPVHTVEAFEDATSATAI